MTATPTRTPAARAPKLNLIRSHAVGVGAPMSAEVVRLMLATKAGSPSRYIMAGTPMKPPTAEQRHEILQLAYWDRLTGLPNRERFRESLARAIQDSRSSAKPLAVITLNVDRFKHVNDVLGYAFGDELLKAVAARLKQQVYREGDLVARLGGDEFLMLLQVPESDAQDQARLIAQRTLAALQAPVTLNGQLMQIGCSIGGALWPLDDDQIETTLELADQALYRAKHAGKNCAAFHGQAEPNPSEAKSD